MEKLSQMIHEGPDGDHIAPNLNGLDGIEQGDAKTKSQNIIYRKADKASNLLCSSQDLADYDWERLQEKFSEAMEEHAQVERDLQEQTTQLLKVLNSLRVSVVSIRVIGIVMLTLSIRHL